MGWNGRVKEMYEQTGSNIGPVSGMTKAVSPENSTWPLATTATDVSSIDQQVQVIASKV